MRKAMSLSFLATTATVGAYLIYNLTSDSAHYTGTTQIFSEIAKLASQSTAASLGMGAVALFSGIHTFVATPVIAVMNRCKQNDDNDLRYSLA